MVDNVGIQFRELVRVLEPRYHMLSCPHFSQEVVPALYCEAKEKVLDDLKKAENVAITTDGSDFPGLSELYYSHGACYYHGVGNEKFCASDSPAF